MDESRKVFSLYPRKRKNLKSVLYVRFRNRGGSWTAGKLTGKCTRAAVEKWAIDYLRSGQVVEKEMITVRELFERRDFKDFRARIANLTAAVTGHLTPAMAENYYHPDDLGDVRLIQENLLASPASTGQPVRFEP